MTATETPTTPFSGTRMVRREDAPLLTGESRFTDDLDIPGALHLAILRSPYAHARITSIDTSAALALPGVVAAYTGEDLADLWTGPVLKLLVRSPGVDPVAFRDAVSDAVGDRATATWTVDGLMEISAIGVTKGVALARLCELRGVEPHDVVAFGDMPNDLAMLAWAGRPYAVASGHPAVLAAVTGRVLPPEQDGVARELELLFDL